MKNKEKNSIDVSFVIPLYNEKDSLKELYNEIVEVMKKLGMEFEIIFVDDGSIDGSFEKLVELNKKDSRVRVIKFRRNFGKSSALSAGFEYSKGKYILTMDADLQDNPSAIPDFFQKMKEENLDLLTGWKTNRQDKWHKVWASWFFNFVTSKFAGKRLHDYNCGFKLYKREVVESLDLYGELHRFTPMIAHRLGFKVDELKYEHRKRKYGKSKFGTARYINGFLDLLTVTFLTGGVHAPLHLFGRIGLYLLFIGIAINAYFGIQWLITFELRVRPLLLLGVTFVILAIQFISFGLLGEMITPLKIKGKKYNIEKIL